MGRCDDIRLAIYEQLRGTNFADLTTLRKELSPEQQRDLFQQMKQETSGQGKLVLEQAADGSLYLTFE